MTQPQDFEGRLARVEETAAAARHLAAAHDRDLSDLGVKVDANRKAINALGIQTRERFDRVEQRFERLEKKVDDGFALMHANFEQINANFGQINANFGQTNVNFERINARFEQINARFEQINARFEQINAQFEQVDRNFLTVRALLDATAASQQRTTELLTILIDEREARGES